MSEWESRWIDRLQDRGLIDRWGFMFFALVGSFAILMAKVLAVPTTIVAIGAIAFMAIYALIVNMRGTGKLRSDQAGDNCYYLGLIYTLTSLAYAIFTFDPEDTATTIVQGFGVALATTVVGLVLRVFFNQSRVDLYEVEESARLELAEAAGELKAQLSQLTLQFKDFAFGLQQSVTEIRDEASDSIANAAKQSIETVQSLADEVSQSLAKQSVELTRSASELAQKAASVSRALERHGKSVDSIAKAHELVVADVGRMAEASASMTSQSKVILEQVDATREIVIGTKDSVDRLDQAIGRINGGASSVLENIGKFQQVFAERLKELEEGPKQTSDRALAAIAKAADAVGTAMKRLTNEQEGAIGLVARATEDLLKIVGQHNVGLERELHRSRENVGKVHGALVDMTAKLNDSMGPG